MPSETIFFAVSFLDFRAEFEQVKCKKYDTKRVHRHEMVQSQVIFSSLNWNVFS